MMASRGMGAIRASKMPKKKVIERKDDPNQVDVYADGGEVWSKPRPSSLGAPKKLSDKKKAKAKAADRKSTRLNSSHIPLSRMPSSA